MKIQCNVCEKAEAKVLCCADEAALCWGCDEKVHAANKLASKHQRVLLSSSSPHLPKCDLCQEAAGFFFCLEDRALLCRKCDVAIHTANPYVSAHQRYLLTGVNVGLESTDPGASSSSRMSPSVGKTSEKKSYPIASRCGPIPLASPQNEVSLPHVGGFGDLGPVKMSFSGGSAVGSIPQWHVDDFLGLTDLNQDYSYTENGSSKDDSGKRGDSDSSAILRSGEEGIEDEFLGQVPDSSCAVPQVHSPPTASGLHWPKSIRSQHDNAVFVPDIFCPNLENQYLGKQHGTVRKQQRKF